MLAAFILREMGNFHAAIVKCKEALQVLSSHPSILSFYGDLLHRIGKSQEAFLVYQEILQKKEISPYVYAALGKHYFQKHQWKEAEEFLLKAIEGFPELEESLLFLGMIYASKKDIPKAISYHEKVKNIALKYKRRNNLGQIYNNLAYLYMESPTPNREKALEYAEKAFHLLPYDGSVADTLGWAYYQNQKYSQSEKHLLYASHLYPKEATILYHLAHVYLKLNNKKSAIHNLEKAVSMGQIFPEFSQAQKLLKEWQSLEKKQ